MKIYFHESIAWEGGKVIRYLCLILFFNLFVGFAQDTPIDTVLSDLEEVADSVSYENDEDEIIYWEKGYYDSIPIGKLQRQDNGVAFDKMISKYQSDDFTYVESIADKWTFLDELKRRIAEFFRNLFPDIDVPQDDNIFKILGIVGGIVVLFLIYKMFFAGKVFIRHASEDIESTDISYVEENLLKVDIQDYLKEALRKEDYALAIRYHHLENVQLLAKRGDIIWDRTKTNHELLDEMSNGELKVGFQNCTKIFDYVWFGGFEITKSEYAKFEQKFKQFQRRWS